MTRTAKHISLWKGYPSNYPGSIVESKTFYKLIVYFHLVEAHTTKISITYEEPVLFAFDSFFAALRSPTRPQM